MTSRTRNTERPSPGRRCPCCGGRMIIVETFDGRAPRARHRRPGSGSTPHDNRRASRLAMLIAFASPRAPEQERDALTTSAASLPLLRPHPPLASSPPKKRVVFAPDDNTGCPPPLPPHGRSVRDPKIPIGPAQPNRASSFPRFPPYEAFGRRPRARPSAPAKGRRPKSFSKADIALFALPEYLVVRPVRKAAELDRSHMFTTDKARFIGLLVAVSIISSATSAAAAAVRVRRTGSSRRRPGRGFEL